MHVENTNKPFKERVAALPGFHPVDRDSQEQIILKVSCP
jgi:hypothetical protein